MAAAAAVGDRRTALSQKPSGVAQAIDESLVTLLRHADLGTLPRAEETVSPGFGLDHVEGMLTARDRGVLSRCQFAVAMSQWGSLGSVGEHQPRYEGARTEN